jgi:AcrR family transcriptional regulator
VRASRLQRRHLARRLDILRAAGREFRTRGFAETGMREIAAAADLSPANLYNYFRGKDEILFFCQDNALDRLIVNLDRTRHARTRSNAQKLHAVITFHLHCVLDEVEGSAAHLLTNSISPNLQRRLLSKRDRYEHGLRQIVAAGIRSGEFVVSDPALIARAMLGALNSTILWFNPQGPLSTEQLAASFASYLVRGLQISIRGRALIQPSVAQPLLAVASAQSPQRARPSSANLSSVRSPTASKKLAKTGGPQW